MNLNQVTLPSLDLTKAIPFYQLLGLRLIVEALPGYARFECPDGEATLSLHLVDTLPEGEDIHVYFECEDLDNYTRQLTDKGLKFDELPTDKPWLWKEARLKDRDNNQIILYYAGGNRKKSPWRVNI